ncbi:MAG: hypothetical protein HYY14_03120 [Candidatus Omnitrophica bacterium]|nr:hypothetical protein [Candidatus Omnitrophota bacterium]
MNRGMMGVLVLAFCFAFSSPLRGEDNQVMTNKGRLFEIKKVQIVGPDKVYLKSSDYVLDSRSPEGGVTDEGHYFTAGGELKEFPKGRQPDEIWLRPGESCNVGTTRQWSILKLLKIQDGAATFDETLFLRSGRQEQRVVKILPYEE